VYKIEDVSVSGKTGKTKVTLTQDVLTGASITEETDWIEIQRQWYLKSECDTEEDEKENK
jgi:hypothetical protein